MLIASVDLHAEAESNTFFAPPQSHRWKPNTPCYQHGHESHYRTATERVQIAKLLVALHSDFRYFPILKTCGYWTPFGSPHLLDVVVDMEISTIKANIVKYPYLAPYVSVGLIGLQWLKALQLVKMAQKQLEKLIYLERLVYCSSVSVSKNATKARTSFLDKPSPEAGCLARFASSVGLRTNSEL